MPQLNNKTRYALITVDTEALPKRAAEDHVRRLIWGEHDKGTAGIREMCSIGDEIGAKLIFFVDVCGSYSKLNEITEVICWLNTAGQDVQLHTHSEYLPEAFWTEHGFKYRPRFLNQYGPDKALFTLRYFNNFISDLTGKPVRAFRAGSFRWNADTIRAMHQVGIPLSFNNSVSAMHAGQCVYSEPTNLPYLWSNGIVEVPITEHKFFPFLGKEYWGRFNFPVWGRFGNPLWRVLNPFKQDNGGTFLVLLLHSWSLLYWDKQGYGMYHDDRRAEGLRKLLRQMAKDYDIITTADFLDLQAQGKIATTHVCDLSLAEMRPLPKKKKAPGVTK